MKNCNKLLAFALAALALTACGDKARIRGTLDGATQKQIIVKQLDVNTFRTLDTLTTGADGSFRYDAQVAAGQPEFIYLFYGDTRIAALLLEKGETVTVKADTLGGYSVEGSAGSTELAAEDKAYADFLATLDRQQDDPAAMTRTYLQHYRDNVRYVMEHPLSLTTIPVFFERLGDAPTFSQTTDALLFRQAADTLKTVYPDSRYVKALEKEAERRMRVLEFDTQLRTAEQANFPDITLPDMQGQPRKLSEVDAKAILVHFWDVTDAAMKMMNLDLLPVYKDYHARGFEVYSVCVTPDKPEWASAVLAQKLPWINVNDGKGSASPAVITYGVADLPYSFLIVDGEVYTGQITGVDGLRKVLAQKLK